MIICPTKPTLLRRGSKDENRNDMQTGREYRGGIEMIEIPAFWGGVIVTIVAIIVGSFVAAIVMSKKKK